MGLPGSRLDRLFQVLTVAGITGWVAFPAILLENAVRTSGAGRPFARRTLGLRCNSALQSRHVHVAWAARHVARHEDVLIRRSHQLVNGDEPARVDLHTGTVEPEAFGVGRATGSNQDLLGPHNALHASVAHADETDAEDGREVEKCRGRGVGVAFHVVQKQKPQ